MTQKLLDLMIDEHEQELKASIKLLDETSALVTKAKDSVVYLDGLRFRQRNNVDYLEQNLKNLKCFNIEKEDE